MTDFVNLTLPLAQMMVQSKFLGVSGGLAIVGMFLCLFMITRQVNEMKLLAFPILVAFRTFGLKAPLWMVAITAIIWGLEVWNKGVTNSISIVKDRAISTFGSLTDPKRIPLRKRIQTSYQSGAYKPTNIVTNLGIKAREYNRDKSFRQMLKTSPELRKSWMLHLAKKEQEDEEQSKIREFIQK